MARRWGRRGRRKGRERGANHSSRLVISRYSIERGTGPVTVLYTCSGCRLDPQSIREARLKLRKFKPMTATRSPLCSLSSNTLHNRSASTSLSRAPRAVTRSSPSPWSSLRYPHSVSPPSPLLLDEQPFRSSTQVDRGPDGRAFPCRRIRGRSISVRSSSASSVIPDSTAVHRLPTELSSTTATVLPSAATAATVSTARTSEHGFPEPTVSESTVSRLRRRKSTA